MADRKLPGGLAPSTFFGLVAGVVLFMVLSEQFPTIGQLTGRLVRNT